MITGFPIPFRTDLHGLINYVRHYSTGYFIYFIPFDIMVWVLRSPSTPLTPRDGKSSRVSR
jgi:hypothetical protein